MPYEEVIRKYREFKIYTDEDFNKARFVKYVVKNTSSPKLEDGNPPPRRKIKTSKGVDAAGEKMPPHMDTTSATVERW